MIDVKLAKHKAKLEAVGKLAIKEIWAPFFKEHYEIVGAIWTNNASRSNDYDPSLEINFSLPHLLVNPYMLEVLAAPHFTTTINGVTRAIAIHGTIEKMFPAIFVDVIACLRQLNDFNEAISCAYGANKRFIALNEKNVKLIVQDSYDRDLFYHEDLTFIQTNQQGE